MGAQDAAPSPGLSNDTRVIDHALGGRGKDDRGDVGAVLAGLRSPTVADTKRTERTGNPKTCPRPLLVKLPPTPNFGSGRTTAVGIFSACGGPERITSGEGCCSTWNSRCRNSRLPLSERRRLESRYRAPVPAQSWHRAPRQVADSLPPRPRPIPRSRQKRNSTISPQRPRARHPPMVLTDRARAEP